MEYKVVEVKNPADLPSRFMRCFDALNQKDAFAAYAKGGFPPAKVVYKWSIHYFFDTVGEDAQEKE